MDKDMVESAKTDLKLNSYIKVVQSKINVKEEEKFEAC